MFCLKTQVTGRCRYRMRDFGKDLRTGQAKREKSRAELGVSHADVQLAFFEGVELLLLIQGFHAC